MTGVIAWTFFRREFWTLLKSRKSQTMGLILIYALAAVPFLLKHPPPEVVEAVESWFNNGSTFVVFLFVWIDLALNKTIVLLGAAITFSAMLTRSSRKRNLSGRQTREGSSSSIVRRIAIALGLLVFVGLSLHSPVQSAEQNSFQAELYEDLPDDWREAWSFEGLQPAMTWTSHDLGQIFLPGKLSPIGRTMHRARPFALRIHGHVELPAVVYRSRVANW